MNYVIISPVKNEEEYIEKTLRSVTSQTVKPVKWVIVNDGSTDGTEELIEAFRKKYDWIKVVNKTDRGFYKLGSGVIEAFYTGYKEIAELNFAYLVKLDGDLSFESDYFEKIFHEFEKNPRLGIASGVWLVPKNHKLILQKPASFHTLGPTKVYRRKCFDEIDGLVPSLGWDTIDDIKARMLGWETKNFSELRVVHWRPMGSYLGVKGIINIGRAAYYAGWHPVFMIFRSLRRMLDKPYLIRGFLLFYGYVEGYMKKGPRYSDRSFIKFMRKQQINRLLGRPTIWQ